MEHLVQQVSPTCPLPKQRYADRTVSPEELMRRLPAERGSASARASLELSLGEKDLLIRAAGEANASVEDYLLAGFTGLLARLAWQEKISIVRYAPAPSITTCSWEQGLGLRAGLSSMRTESLPSNGPVPNGAGYQFLRDAAPVFSPNRADLLLTAREEAQLLSLILTSSTARWTEATLQRWLSSLRSLLLAAAQSPDASLRTLPLLDEAAILSFYEDLNRTASKYDDRARVNDLISQQVARSPEAIAVVYGDRRLTYRQLDEQSTLRAQCLVAIGAGPNRPVAVCMQRSEQLPVALLAILKSGSCYVPLDPLHPRQRILSALEECKPVAVLSDSVVEPSLRDLPAPVLCMDRDWPAATARGLESAPLSADDLAYIIYTSGSTGKPKGVQIRHRSLVNLFDPESRMPKLAPGDRLLAVTTISFDIATMDMLMPLASGATLVVADRFAAGDPFELARLLDESDATFLQATPFTWRLLVNSGWMGKRNLKMISGGEALPRDLANQLLPLGPELWNCYGPTETAIYSGATRLTVEDGIVPLGPPIANTTFYVVDEAGKPLPPGVPGELCIGGVGVSPGYLERPELTAKRFIPDTISSPPGGTLFRTGDLVRTLDRRELEFMGRLDHQVKLRGYRIELAEIESVLRAHPMIENAAVVLREDVEGEPRLVAYVTRYPETQLATSKLKEYASQFLPEYMLPARIVSLAVLPLTSSGKVDRRALPLPEIVSEQEDGLPESANVLPENELEAKLLDIFREVLGKPSIGVTDSFFDYGGYSLLTARLFARIHCSIGKKLPISLLFDAPTARNLADVIRKGEPLPMVVPIRKEGRAAPLFVIHSYLIYAALCEVIEENRPIYGIRELDDRPVGTLEQCAALYAREINRTYPAGPLNLVGWCLAGSLTVEVARVLREQGRVVALVALFDSERPGYKPQTVNGESLLNARLKRFMRFHSDHMRDLDWPERFRYLSDHSRHRWQETVMSFTVRRRVAFRWLNRNLGFALAEPVRNHLARLGADELRPSEPQFYPGKIALLCASEVVWVPGTEPSLGWNAVAKDGVEVEFAPGDHESMFREPHLPHFGKILQRMLREGEANCRRGEAPQKPSSVPDPGFRSSERPVSRRVRGVGFDLSQFEDR